MKKMCMAAVLLLLFISNYAYAEYRDVIKNLVAQELIDFYNAENGNVLELDNMKELYNKLMTVMDVNLIEAEDPILPGPPGPPE